MRSMTFFGGAYRSLFAFEKAAYLAHLKRLSAQDRRLRFHRAMTDAALAAHVERLFSDQPFGRLRQVIGWFRDGVLRGAAEVQVYPIKPCGLEAEAAFAVETAHRRRGVGRELMQRAALFARNRGATRLHIATERTNRPMLRLAMRSGAEFEISGLDADGVLTSDPSSVFSVFLEAAEEETGRAQTAVEIAWGAWVAGLRVTAAPAMAAAAALRAHAQAEARPIPARQAA